MRNIFFNAHHSPIGAFASFTLGFHGDNGGLGLELGRPANNNIYIGVQNKDNKNYKLLPFFGYSEDDRKRYELEMEDDSSVQDKLLIPFKDEEIIREYKVCTDRWIAGDLDFKIYSQVCSIPDPETANDDDLKKVLLPAVLAEMTVDNSLGTTNRRAFFGYTSSDPYYSMRHVSDEENSIVGIGQGGLTAIVCPKGEAKSAMGFSLKYILNQNDQERWNSGLGKTAALIMDVPPAKKITFRFAVCFYREAIATQGIKSHYYYTKFFKNIEEVGSYALNNYKDYFKKCFDFNKEVEKSLLSEEQKFMMSHAIRSYYGSTELLEADGKAVWIVNEGEYRMMNTLDLTVDQLFYEMKMNPWTVRNVLDLFLSRYSYQDNVCFPKNPKEYPGGIAFTHDMGVANIFSSPGYSSYERPGLHGCLSYMTHEELVNWLCCASVYIENSEDDKWLNKNINTLIDCFLSMVNRDHPDPEKRTGMMKLDSNRTKSGTEITTYDSLDISLGQGRSNIYLGGKCWAVYLALERIFKKQYLDSLSKQAQKQADLCAQTLAGSMNKEGFIPAVLETGNKSRIIPAVEGLVFPYFTGCKEALDPNGRYGYYISTLKKHFKNVLVEGTCLFDNGGWKLSSTSNNSWLSKIYLCQFVARKILEFKSDDCGINADKVHVRWLTDPQNSYWCWGDQYINGVLKGSRYYPRGVTSILWLDE